MDVGLQFLIPFHFRAFFLLVLKCFHEIEGRQKLYIYIYVYLQYMCVHLYPRTCPTQKVSQDGTILTKLPLQQAGRKGNSGGFKFIFYNTFSIKGPFYTQYSTNNIMASRMSLSGVMYLNPSPVFLMLS